MEKEMLMARREWFKISSGFKTYNDGTKEYLNKDGELHREDGPAAEWASGERLWFLNNTKMTFNEWCDQLKKTDTEKAYYLLKHSSGYAGFLDY